MRSEFKGTKGNWKKIHEHDYTSCSWVCIKNENGDTLAEVKGFHYGIKNIEMKRNAKLIAAAPDLLEALQIVKANYEHFGNDSSKRKICRRVIRKERERCLFSLP